MDSKQHILNILKNNLILKKGLRFRIGVSEDSQAVSDLVNSVYRGDNAKKGWTTEANLLDGIRINSNKVNEIINTDNNIILLSLKDSKIIGCVHLEKKGNKSHLGMLWKALLHREAERQYHFDPLRE